MQLCKIGKQSQQNVLCSNFISTIPSLVRPLSRTPRSRCPNDLRLVPPLARHGAHFGRAHRLLLAEDADRAELSRRAREGQRVGVGQPVEHEVRVLLRAVADEVDGGALGCVKDSNQSSSYMA